jgi:UDP-N-acetylglucosamine 1-carboxyvinyltransferase
VKSNTRKNAVSLKSPNTLRPTNVDAKPFPKFPTDMQAQWTVLMTQANGTSKITDHIYADRFKHVPELNRLGANIEVKGNSAIVKGVQKTFRHKKSCRPTCVHRQV